MTMLREPELDLEREVDVRQYASTVATRWWLPLVGVVAGVVVGYLLSLGGGQVYRAQALVYLGQPFSPGGGSPVQGLATNPRIVGEIVRSEAALRAAAARSGIRVGQLRGRVSTEAIVGTPPRAVQTPLVEIGVHGSAPARVAVAANTLAARVVAEVSDYPNIKIRTFKNRLEGINSRLESAADRIEALNAALRAGNLSVLERLELISEKDNSEQRRGQLLDQQSATQQSLALAERIESARVVEPAVAVKSAARSTRTSIAVGAVIGLLLGILAALLWEPASTRLTRRPRL